MTDRELENRRQRHRRYYRENRERILARQRAEYAADPEGCRAYQRAKRAKRRDQMGAEVRL